MACFQHAVVLEPAPRDWFEDKVRLGHDGSWLLGGAGKVRGRGALRPLGSLALYRW